MNYDITFCEGDGCPRRGSCHRYLELLRFQADKDPDKETCVSITRPAPAECTLYWKEPR